MEKIDTLTAKVKRDLEAQRQIKLLEQHIKNKSKVREPFINGNHLPDEFLNSIDPLSIEKRVKDERANTGKYTEEDLDSLKLINHVIIEFY